MANAIFNYFKKAILVGSFNLQALPTIFVALVNNSYSPDVDTHIYRSSITAYEVSGSGYVAGGLALSSPLVTQDNTGNQGVLDGSDMMWTPASITARGAILYGSSGLGAASDPLLGYLDFTSNQAAVAGTFKIQWAAEGILALT